MWVNTKQNLLQARWTHPITGETKIVSVKITNGRRAAEKKLREKLENISTSQHMRFSEVADKWLAEQELTVKESTLRRNTYSMNRAVKALGDPWVDRLTAGYIKQCLRDTGKPVSAMNELLKRIKACLKWAYKNDILQDYNVIGKLDMFPTTSYRERIKDKFLEPEEVQKTLDAMEIPRWRLLTEFLVLSGLRIGEAIALDQADVTDTISVTKTADTYTNEITPPKTFTSTREVPVQEELAKCIAEIRECMKWQSLNYGYGITPYFFTGSDGKRVNYFAYAAYLKKKTKEAIGRPITPHALRHTHASLLLAQGVSVETISRRLGHESSKITQEIYLHVTKKLREADAEEVKTIRLLAE